MFKWLFKKQKVVKPPKDPEDFSWTKINSTRWTTENYCPHCHYGNLTHAEKMADICDQCGGILNGYYYRSYRQIWDGEKWTYQYIIRAGTPQARQVEIYETKLPGNKGDY